ncbi:hypothetical protein COV06_04455 [Candidatus Uhrbacteria bacterium CG10_big_fil_rev_8_21_14_0_10_50_16]|uniref:Clp R domain-containing protein n=1 Tax=Candidatus Uhrbacteria bacterium CG10_big_fil_rev_8_21_14_0_10_50_16 TaxID=1975039 RepID=A0A2H0RMT6_9BACT|nr:MAG: hypothetical protein COV06_04455 [Candidatus Uhrbacteria bacterium CG10_big_fil_rev_8_21_14_0_10_50_16]
MNNDLVDKFTSHLRNVLTRALLLSIEVGSNTIAPEHLLWSAATEKGSVGAELLRKAQLDSASLGAFVGAPEDISESKRLPSTRLPQLSETSKRVLEKAVLSASMYEHHHIGTEHLIAGILQVSSKELVQFLQTSNVNIEELRSQLAVLLRGTQQFPHVQIHAHEAKPSLSEDVDISELGLDDQPDGSALEFFATELTAESQQLDPVIGRDSEIQRVMEILSRRTKNNPILVGEPGVGKTAIVEGLARKIVMGDVPPVLLNKRLFSLDLGSLIAGTMYRGEFEGRLKQIIEEVRDSNDIILFIDEVHMIVGAGSASGSLDAANLLKPALARGWIHCIGATTPAEYKKHIEQDGALERRFQSITVNEPTRAQAIKILRGISPVYETYHQVSITDEALVYAVEASERYLPGLQLPDKAIDLIDEAAATLTVADRSPKLTAWKQLEKSLQTVRTKKRDAIMEERYLDASLHKEQEADLESKIGTAEAEAKQQQLGVVDVATIARVLEKKTGIRVTGLLQGDRTHLKRIEQKLKRVIYGQHEVVEQVARHVRRAKTGLHTHQRPLASFLFVGPSGTGKSELAKQLAEQVYLTKDALIRIDMSEYVERHSISKLIGSPPGYVGYRDEALLTDQVKKKPHSVVLFDEIEKAHPDIHNLLLQILENGELTDATGRVISFKHTLVVLTSNIGSTQFLNGAIGFNAADLTESDVRRILQTSMRPELINRIDSIGVFHPLTQRHLVSVAERELKQLQTHMAQDARHLTWDQAVKQHIVEQSQGDLAGARNIRQRVEDLVATLIADHLLNEPDTQDFMLSINNGQIDLQTKTR